MEPPISCGHGCAPSSAIPKRGKNRIIPVVNNSWGGGMAVNEKLALRMIRIERNSALRCSISMRDGFAESAIGIPTRKSFLTAWRISRMTHIKQGLRFGIWVDWTQAALDTEPGALNVRDPKVRDWLVADTPPNWKPEEFKGQTVDVGVPAAHDYFAKEVKRMVNDYHLDMLEQDGYLVAKGCTATTIRMRLPIAAQ